MIRALSFKLVNPSIVYRRFMPLLIFWSLGTKTFIDHWRTVTQSSALSVK